MGRSYLVLAVLMLALAGKSRGAAAAPPVEPISTVVFHGAVIGPDGKPLAGVVVHSELWNFATRETLEEAAAPSGTDGQFTLPPLPPIDRFPLKIRTLVIDDPRYALAWQRVGSQFDWLGRETPLRLQVARASRIAGVVRDQDGKPVPGARIGGTMTPGGDRWDFLMMDVSTHRSTLTDAQGRFALERIPEGAKFYLSAHHPRYAPYPPPTRNVENAGFVQAGDESCAVTLAAGITVAAQLQRAGHPWAMAGISVSLWDEKTGEHATEAWTDEQGRAALGAAPGRYYLIANDTEFARQGLAPVIMSGVTAQPAGADLQLNCTPGQVVHGRFIDADTGAGFPALSFVLLKWPARSLMFETLLADAHGDFSIRLPPGAYQFRSRAWLKKTTDPRHDPRNLECVVTADAAPEPLIFKVNPFPQATGRLVDQAGQPLQGYVTMDQEGAFTDAQGHFSVRAPLPNDDPVLGLAFDKSRQLSAVFRYSPATAGAPLNLELAPMATLHGKLFDDKNHPITKAGFTLDLASSDGPRSTTSRFDDETALWKTQIAGDGAFTLSPVFARFPMRLTVHQTGYRDAQVSVKCDPGELHEVGDIKLELLPRNYGGGVTWDAAVTGRIVDEQDQPVSNAEVSGITLSPEDNNPATAVTDRKGAFTLKNLPRDTKIRIWPQLGARQSAFLLVSVAGKNITEHATSFVEVTAPAADLTLQLRPQGYEWLGKTAPPLIVQKWIGDTQPVLSDLQGKVVVLALGLQLDFEHHSAPATALQTLWEKYRSRGVMIIGLHNNVRATPDEKNPETPTEEQVANWIAQEALTFPIAVDAARQKAPATVPADRTGSATFALYGALDTPVIFLIDKTGLVRKTTTPQTLDADLQPLLLEPPPTLPAPKHTQ